MNLKNALIILVFFPIILSAHQHYEYWSKFQIEKTIYKHLSLGSDLQYRSQSNYTEDALNVFGYPLVNSARFWVNYKSDKVTLLVSPYAWFRNHDFDLTGRLNHREEWRMAAGIQRLMENKHGELTGRILYEHREFITHSTHQDRVRFLARVKPLILDGGKAPLQPYLQEEFFLLLEPSPYFCDQNRVQTGLKYRKKILEISVAYQWTMQRTSTWITRHQLYTGIQLTLI